MNDHNARQSVLICAVIALAAVSLAACGGEKKEVLNRESFQAVVGDWPLTVSSATVACGQKNRESLGVEVNGNVYALNGTGKTFEGWDELKPIWAPDPSTGGFVPVSDLLNYVSGYCARQ